MYLIRKNQSQKKAHIWTGDDTQCRMWSTGGIRKRRSWIVSETARGYAICKLCSGENSYQDYDPQKEFEDRMKNM
jgi:hypothetical protein